MENEPTIPSQENNSPVLIKSYLLLLVNFFFYSIPLHVWQNKYKPLLIVTIIVADIIKYRSCL